MEIENVTVAGYDVKPNGQNTFKVMTCKICVGRRGSI